MDHSSDVWLVKTEKKEFIVRSSRMTGESDSEFWKGCKQTFGVDPRNVHSLEVVNNILCNLSSIRIPKVIRKGYIDREYIVVEKLDGEVIESFVGQPRELLFSLGKGLTQIHKHKLNYVGNPLGTFRVEFHKFHEHIASVMKLMLEEFYMNNDKIVNALPSMVESLKYTPLPEEATFILVDMDAMQFFSDGKRVTGLVDTEAYVIGPRELDFIALEFILDAEGAKSFSEGYKEELPIPDLSLCRMPYRYLYRLIEIQGREDLDKWLNYPILF